MHYIIGTEIYIDPVQTLNQGSGPQPINAQQVHRQTRNVGPFAPGVKYSLYNIRKVEQGLEYQFIDDTGQNIPLVFESTSQADAVISQIKNEPLPDYTSFYRGRGG